MRGAQNSLIAENYVIPAPLSRSYVHILCEVTALVHFAMNANDVWYSCQKQECKHCFVFAFVQQK